MTEGMFDMFGDNSQAQPEPQKQTKPPKMAQPVQTQSAAPNATPEGNLKLLYAYKKDYTDAEWDQRENIYIEEANKIILNSSNLMPNDIYEAANQIMALLFPLHIDNVYAQQNIIRYDGIMKVEKEKLFNAIKQSAQTKLTVDEVKSAIADQMDNTIMDQNMTIFELSRRYNKRKIFTDGLIKSLQEKKELLVTYNGVLKIESSLSNMTPSVPK